MKPDTLRARMRRRGWTREQARRYYSPLGCRGPDTMLQRARAAGLNPSTIYQRVVYRGMTIDEAIQWPSGQHSKHTRVIA